MSLHTGSGSGSGASKGNAPGITGATSSSIGATSVDDPAGAKLESVDSSGRAARFGLQTGDVVRKINDQTVNGAASFLKLMSGVTQGSAVSIQVLRDGKETTIGREATSNGGRFVQMGTKIGTLNTK
jgi:S1-C subfamily serine protease